jgi:MerR family transcriptional regulator, heat shock protein HspR
MARPPRNIPADNNGDLAKYTMSVTVTMTGVAAYKIRRFEEFGLCKPARTGARHRLYSDGDVQLIREISILEKEGINLIGIKTILEIQKSSSKKLHSRENGA